VTPAALILLLVDGCWCGTLLAPLGQPIEPSRCFFCLLLGYVTLTGSQFAAEPVPERSPGEDAQMTLVTNGNLKELGFLSGGPFPGTRPLIWVRCTTDTGQGHDGVHGLLYVDFCLWCRWDRHPPGLHYSGAHDLYGEQSHLRLHLEVAKGAMCQHAATARAKNKPIFSFPIAEQIL
jgi:hypothetical protein